MQRLLRCECGYEVRADDDTDLVARAQHHALEAHGMPLTRDDVLRLALRAGEASAPQRLEAPKGGGR